jgi:hypothetical protein
VQQRAGRYFLNADQDTHILVRRCTADPFNPTFKAAALPYQTHAQSSSFTVSNPR